MVMKEILELAKAGGIKAAAAVRKWFKNSEIINEINSRIDSEVFFDAASTDDYKYVEDIRENDIFDKFIEYCVSNTALGFDIEQFVDKYYKDKSGEAREYVIAFFKRIAKVIEEVLIFHSSTETKLIISGQKTLEEILKRLESDRRRNGTPTLVVRYSANMQNKMWSLESFKYDVDHCNIIDTIDISMQNFPMYQKDGVLFWQIEKKSLEDAFKNKVLPRLELGLTVDLYGLAPIPLLVLLGNLFANRPNINIYQLKKNPSTFAWSKRGKKLNIVTTWLSCVQSPEVALVMSFSGKVNIDNVKRTIGNDKAIVEMGIEEPYDDFLRTKKQLDEFLTEYRKLKAAFERLGIKKVHLFAAIPVAFAIGIGQAYNSNYDAEIVTYDYKQGQYTEAISIGGSE